jgi:hypothetical protein
MKNEVSVHVSVWRKEIRCDNEKRTVYVAAITGGSGGAKVRIEQCHSLIIHKGLILVFYY